ncbi:hypothetical protein SAMN05216410_3007 [Sanguibacter gelidistatuariae]|uniref:Uncharacterized protein n=1 Tax=Sanguibacter gelidistatuariae TaxID=1814289 RepID=A0A1G6T2Z7_9MICO|nr:hypothetical protein [Sanguibacter gelidistatuariae]SDD23381.1 hypothetical protein SAMN05216410_3007 [Sanguibacter gelidistatuariae]
MSTTTTTTPSTPTAAPHRGRAPARELHDNDALLADLVRIDAEGWNGPTATRVLADVRSTMVRSMVAALGLHGVEASQAEASAWEAAWEELAAPRIRQANSPWGVLARVIRRAVATEMVTARYGTTASKAWKLAHSPDGATFARPVAFDASVHDAVARGGAGAGDLGDEIINRELLRCVLGGIGQVLISAGWSREDAQRLALALLSFDPGRPDGRATMCSWRRLALHAGIPQWQAHRVLAVVRGSGEHEGLFDRALRGDLTVDDDPVMVEALASTVVQSRRPPTALYEAPRSRAA